MCAAARRFRLLARAESGSIARMRPFSDGFGGVDEDRVHGFERCRKRTDRYRQVQSMDSLKLGFTYG